MKKPSDVKKKLVLNPSLPKEVAARIAANTVKTFAPLPPPESGTQIADGSIYLGVYSPKDRQGKSLGKIFNAFSAPENLPKLMEYIDAVKYIAKLKNWHGYDGMNYPSDKEIYTALKDGSYNGGWIIPPRELLVGTEFDGGAGIRQGKIIQPDNLFDYQNKGNFKGTFDTAGPRDGSESPDWYFSSTEYRYNLSHIWVVRFLDGFEDWESKNDGRFSCRPVRLTEVKP